MSAVKKPHRKLVAVDFDGVLHAYTTPWTDAVTISDGPTPGAMRFLKNLSDDDRFDVVIVSSRLNDENGYQAVQRWIKAYAESEFGPYEADTFVPFLRYSKTRPPAFITIDDRGWHFTGQWPSLDDLAAFVPWNKRPAPTPAVDTPPLDGFQLNNQLAKICVEEWTTITSEAGMPLPNFEVPEEEVGYRPIAGLPVLPTASTR